MKIVEAAVRRRRLYLLRLEDGQEQTVDRQTFDESPYGVGADITPEQWDALLEQSQYNRARERALYLLGLRDYACHKLQQKLLTEATPEIAAAVVDRLVEVGLLDDAAYARRLARHLTEYKQYPRRRVEQELRRKGLAPDHIRDAVDSLDGEDFRLALALLEKKYYNKINDPQGRQRVTAALARRGFSYGAIRRAMEEFGFQNEENEPWQ